MRVSCDGGCRIGEDRVMGVFISFYPIYVIFPLFFIGFHLNLKPVVTYHFRFFIH